MNIQAYETLFNIITARITCIFTHVSSQSLGFCPGSSENEECRRTDPSGNCTCVLHSRASRPDSEVWYLRKPPSAFISLGRGFSVLFTHLSNSSIRRHCFRSLVFTVGALETFSQLTVSLKNDSKVAAESHVRQ